MNLHVPQSLQTSVELKYLASVSKHIISPSTNAPIIGPAQDNLLGLFKITDDNVFFTHQEIMNLLVGVQKFTGILPEPITISKKSNSGNDIKLIRWTGKQLYSVILPPITYYNKMSSKNPNLKDVIIENGILKQGQLEKTCSVAILHYICNDYGNKEATRYLNDLQKIVSRYLIRSGFSVGISDLIVDKEIRKRNEEIILQSKKDIVELTKKVHLNILEDITDGLDILYETKIRAINKNTSDGIRDDIMKKLPLTNRINYIVTSGSKGAAINIMQMMCLLGEQAIDGKRVPMGFADRTLPHYPRFENGAESRGFISSNFINGLNPQEFFFHAMAGREGVIDTAVKTATSGYLQRKLVKSMEDLKVAHDFSVRGSNNDIVQFCYGYDGFNSTDLEKQTSNFIKIDIDKLNKNYYIDITDKFEYVAKSEIDKMKKIDGWKKIIQEYNEYIKNKVEDFHRIYSKFNFSSNKKIDDVVLYYPINFSRLILTTTKQFNLDDVNKSDIHPIEIIKEIKELIKYCSIDNRYNLSCEILIWDNLSPKILLRDKKFNRIAFMHVINAIKSRFKYSLAEGGDMVGPLAAQSLGEQSTQMTLNSVDWETEIVIAKNGELLLPKIGEFIDDYYEACLADPARASTIQYIKCPGKDDQIYIPLDDGNDWRAYSCDENGNVMWTKLEAITRHPVVNEDGSETILEVELECGRTVKATKGRSFLVYDEANNIIIDKNGSDLKEDDLIPVCEGLELENSYFNEITHLDVKKYLLPSEYIYRDEVDKALTEMNSGDRRWFFSGQGIKFTVPYNRIDSFKEAFIGTSRRESILLNIKEGCVYPKNTSSCKSNIPSMIPLNNDFGYFIGAYLADGMANELRIIISKGDNDFIAPIKTLMASWDIGYRFVNSVKKEADIENDKKAWESNDHIFQSTLLADLLGKVFGKTSNDKLIPTWILQTPKEFLKGIISGYFSGDGCVDKDGSISASSIGKQMLEIIGLILNRFSISWTIHKTKQDRNKYPNAKEYIYNISIPREYNLKFSENFKFTIQSKAERLLKYNNKDSKTKKKFYKHFKNVLLRKVKTITEVLPTEKEYNKTKKRWVYDLTVEKTRNFASSSLYVVKDTFHQAGVAEKSAVTQGTARLTELLSNTKLPKNSSCEIFLDEDHRYSQELAEKVANNIELTTIRDVLSSTAIYLEPNNDYGSVLEEDREFLEIYRTFSEMDSQSTQIPDNPWLIRLEFDRRKIIDKKITMEDISIILKTNYPQASMMFMDDNAAKLVFRLRLTFQSNLNKANDDILFLEEKINEISDIVIKGVDGINYVHLITDKDKLAQIVVKENGSFVEKKEYKMSTGGSNLFDILIRKGVDSTRTYSIDPNEMYSIFGIEAARFQIKYELNNVLLASDIKLSPRHLDLLCDKMCQHGDIMSVSRHGIKNENIGPLAKASFEQTTDQLLEASLFGAFDNIKGVSSNIMVGQIPTCGTGDSTVLLDEDLLNTQEDLIPEEEVNIEEYFKTSEYCEGVDIKLSLGDINPNDGEYDDYPDVFVE
uniref:DNA-directed RNA polymerase n=1 Tax=viral metagenome TaxID=1070528 RepID=A0A6C0F4Q7_9ZZZZ